MDGGSMAGVYMYFSILLPFFNIFFVIVALLLLKRIAVALERLSNR